MSLLSSLRAPVALSPVQLAEVWGCASDSEGVALLGRIADLGDAHAEPRLALWLDFLYETLAFGKAQSFSAAKALAALDLIKATACHAVDATASGDGDAKGELARGRVGSGDGCAPSVRWHGGGQGGRGGRAGTQETIQLPFIHPSRHVRVASIQPASPLLYAKPLAGPSASTLRFLSAGLLEAIKATARF